MSKPNDVAQPAPMTTAENPTLQRVRPMKDTTCGFSWGGVHLIVLGDVLELAVHLKSKEEVVPEQRVIINEGRRTILDASLGAHDHLRRREDPPLPVMFCCGLDT